MKNIRDKGPLDVPPSRHFMKNRGIKRRVSLADRRQKIAELFRKNPGITQKEIAQRIGVDGGTVSRDIKVITEEIQFQTTDDYLMHHNRMLREIHTKKQLCEDRLERLSGEAHRGARWMEEWTKLANLEIRILGLNAPERFLIERVDKINKEEQDRAVNAALDCIGDVIDITPKLPESDKENASNSQ